MTGARAAIVREVAVTTLVVLGIIRLVVQFLSGMWWDLPMAVVPILFMWAPVWTLQRRGIDPDRYPLAIPALGDRATWWRAARLAGTAILLVGPPFVLLYHLWQTWLFPTVLTSLCDAGVHGTCGLARTMARIHPAWRPPALDRIALLVAYHLFFVGIPEEIFYRGYVQSRLDEVWAPRWRIAGATLGPGWLVTCLVFALGHSLVAFQWWHFAIFFPSLVFGWMRARSGGILAGAFFHAWSNVTVGILDVLYGLQQP
ncbi:MAG: CPBP family intramembrane metalloprotease [Alphaproteobacteria bacterium]|nr:CPBP family intramembrane metalloprotease [Alphaproteobacteria bacterium]